MRFLSDPRLRYVLFLLFGLASLSLAGCGPRYARVYPASGKVVYKDGKPVSGGIIEFESPDFNASGPIKPNARATIQEDGTFRMTSLAEGDGSVAGRHRVVVIAALDGDNEGRPKKSMVPKKYRSYDTSGLAVDVAEGENQFTITIDRQ